MHFPTPKDYRRSLYKNFIFHHLNIQEIKAKILKSYKD